jgi:hypothetical protein
MKYMRKKFRCVCPAGAERGGRRKHAAAASPVDEALAIEANFEKRVFT